MPRLSGIDSGLGAHAPRVGTGAKRTPEQPNLRLATVGKPKSRPKEKSGPPLRPRLWSPPHSGMKVANR
ncbi:MAG: hypothetical protein ACK498_14540 [Cyclobacteriaceae bacterium]